MNLIRKATSRQNSVEPPVKTVTTSQKEGSLTSRGRSDAETEYWSMGGEGAVLEHVYSECGQPENDYSEPLDSLGRLYASPPVGGEEKRRSEEEEVRRSWRCLTKTRTPHLGCGEQYMNHIRTYRTY